MSWNITGTGTKAAIKKEIAQYFEGCKQSAGGTPSEAEYSAAEAALVALVDSAPDGHLLQIGSWGSANYGADYPYFDAHIELKLVAPTLRE